MSAVEAAVSTAAGFLVSLALTYWVLPIWGFVPTVGASMQITAVYTLASFLRGWAIREIFGRWARSRTIGRS